VLEAIQKATEFFNDKGVDSARLHLRHIRQPLGLAGLGEAEGDVTASHRRLTH
jgi:hypothetical protein